MYNVYTYVHYYGSTQKPLSTNKVWKNANCNCKHNSFQEILLSDTALMFCPNSDIWYVKKYFA